MRKLLLVGWDSADWRIIHPLLDAGEMPGVQWLVEGGSSGSLTTLEPQLSPMLWTSIATGRMAYDHGVCGFTEVNPDSGQVVPVSWATRRCRTVWEILSQRGMRCQVVNWFATHGERAVNGSVVSDHFSHLGDVPADEPSATWPHPPEGTFWPPHLADALVNLRVSPHELDPEQVLRLFVPQAHRIDQSRDQRLWLLARHLAEAFSVHAAATHLLEHDPGWSLSAVYYRSLDEISHIFMPYHPPRMEGVAEEDHEIYQHVVASTYRLHDLFLRRLIHLAGPDATVMLVSDHGFHSDHLRPPATPDVPAGITVWHRSQGVFAVRGPGIRGDELVHGAQLLDITPTILHAFGLPIGADMEGRVLEEIFGERLPPAVIPTWEEPGGIVRRHLPPAAAGAGDLAEHFAALGYIESPADAEEARAATNRENDWNLARALLDRGQFFRALPLLTRCSDDRPGRTDFAQLLASCQLQLGMIDAADRSAERALAAFGPPEKARLLRASIDVQRGRFVAALETLETVRRENPSDPAAWLLLAQTFVALRRWSDAEIAARRAIDLDPESPRPYLALARQQIHRRKPDAAIESALRAIGLQYGNPSAHFLLGVALSQQRHWEDSLVALHTCLRLEPQFLRAYRLAARALRALGRLEEAAAHQSRYAALCDAARSWKPPAAALERAPHAPPSCDAPPPASAPRDFLIVTGLPRSGTSLMMQVLAAGGIDVMTDDRRGADADNPDGYWEWEPIKRLPRDPSLIERAGARAIKIVSPLLRSLPSRHTYTVIHMLRPVDEVVASQQTMLARGGRPTADAAFLAAAQARLREETVAFLGSHPQFRVLDVSYADLVASPQPVLERLKAFLPGRFAVTAAAVACVKPALHRHRGSGLAGTVGAPGNAGSAPASSASDSGRV